MKRLLIIAVVLCAAICAHAQNECPAGYFVLHRFTDRSGVLHDLECVDPTTGELVFINVLVGGTDANISRCYAGRLCVGNGTEGDDSGTIDATAIFHNTGSFSWGNYAYIDYLDVTGKQFPSADNAMSFGDHSHRYNKFVGGPDMAGTATLTAGSATVTFGAAYDTVAPICTCTDQTSAAATKCTATTTALTITGTGTDVIGYICIGH